MATAMVERSSHELKDTAWISSAGGLLALLEEEEVNLKIHALTCLVNVVDQHWAEISSSVPVIESLSEDSFFPARHVASFLASKVFFHLEEYNDALRFALGAENLFDVSSKSEYVVTLTSKCIDEYIDSRSQKEEVQIDSRLEAIVEKVFERCLVEKVWTEAIGIALESRRLDIIEKTIRAADADQIAHLLAYTFDVCQTLVTVREERFEVLKILVKIYSEMEQVDHASVIRCLQVLGDAPAAAEVLIYLISTEETSLLAYQIAFDLVESENQNFTVEIAKHLSKPKETEENDEAAVAVNDQDVVDRTKKMLSVLSGSLSADLSLNFMFKQCNTDFLIMNTIKSAVETRNSVLHNATVAAHAYMNAGTTVDTFLRDNLEWMGRATNWGKFSATASIGVVHKGHMSESMSLLQPYLPQGGISSSPYSEGGALYALGLIHANRGGTANLAERTQNRTEGSSQSIDVITYLAEALRNAGNSDPVLHGACLGLGLASMATGNEELYGDLKNTLYMDSAVAGEAAAIGQGLLMLGLGNSTAVSSAAVSDMIAYAHDTQHEKIIRGLAIGIALIMYRQEDEAELIVEQMSRDRDPILRYGAMYTIGLAYCGTSSNAAVKRLLHVAVSDVSDDVRLAAVTCLGFVMCREPNQVPQLVILLAESFNAHVRYGACMAIGIACAGTGSSDAMDILEPMMDDMIDFVRQGATIAMAMVLMQQSEAKVPKIKAFRARLTATSSDKHQTTMTKMGAIMAQGIIDAGGRNVTITMQSRAGFLKMSTVVGLALFCQHWYWYPLMHFLSLAFSPTLLIGLNKDFKMPRSWYVNCSTRSSLFAYPKKLEEKKEDRRERVTTATLSTTLKAEIREKRKKLGKKVDENSSAALPMDIDRNQKHSVTFEESIEESKLEVSKVKKKEVEPNSFTCGNPSRITPSQEPFITFEMNQRYVPVRVAGKPVGIIMLVDTNPGETEDVAAIEAPSRTSEAGEATPPEPFEWTPQ